jgi:hypothetical protein
MAAALFFNPRHFRSYVPTCCTGVVASASAHLPSLIHLGYGSILRGQALQLSRNNQYHLLAICSITKMHYSLTGSMERSVDDYAAMYERVRCAPQMGRSSSHSDRSEPIDVTGTTPASTPPHSPTPPELLEVTLDDPEYDQISDQEEVVEEEACWRREPLAVRRRAMAADFSEGHLETLVDSPQKELAGTQNQYVSYQVTTKVGTACSVLLEAA